MNAQVVAVIAGLVWGAVFLFQLVAMWVVADVEKRWNEEWALDWESRNGRPIDELIEKTAAQIQGWRRARRLLSIYLVFAIAVMAVVVLVQWQGWVMSGPEFEAFMRFLLGITGLLFMPLWAASWIGAGLAESLYRQVRRATGERLEISSAEEVERSAFGKVPKPKPAPAAQPAPAAKLPAPPAAPAAPKPKS